MLADAIDDMPICLSSCDQLTDSSLLAAAGGCAFAAHAAPFVHSEKDRALSVGAVHDHPFCKLNIDNMNKRVSPSVLADITGLMGGSVINDYNRAYGTVNQADDHALLRLSGRGDSAAAAGGLNIADSCVPVRPKTLRYKTPPRLRISTYNGNCWNTIKQYVLN